MRARPISNSLAGCLFLFLIGCSGSSNSGSGASTTYSLTVNSTNPASGIAITISPADTTGSGSGTTSLTRTYDAGTSVTLTAPATSGVNTFASWSGCATTSATTCNVTLNANTTVTANYAVPTTYVLTISSTNPTSGVPITVSPADTSGNSSGSTSLTRVYNAGTSVTLTAPATSGVNTFSSWTGCTTTSTTTCNVTLNANTTVTANYTVPTTYTLTVNSTNPTTGVPITVSPADTAGNTSGSTSFTRSYDSGTKVTLVAPTTAGTSTFSSWTGCTTASTTTCTETLNANATVTATYTANAVTSVSITPNPASATIGNTIQFAATVNGVGSFNSAVTWSVSGSAGYSGGIGDITNSTPTSASSGLYTTPYPAPPSVTITATSNGDATKSASVTLTLAAPAAGAGPALSVDLGTKTRAISPNIYGMDDYTLTAPVPALVSLPIERWGGDDATRYNYLLDVSNSAADYYFESFPNGTGGYPDVSQFNTQVEQDETTKTATIGTVPLIGWTTQRTTACSYSVAKYEAQKQTDPYRPDCGLGVLLNGNNIVNDPTDTSTAIDETFTSGWVQFLVNKFGTAANGGVAIYDLDNEPEYWNAVHKDVHPMPMTYDELTTKGLTYAQAIKAQDPTALVSGFVISNWMNYFYSASDVQSGYSTGPCYCQNGNPVDRIAHGNVPLIDYYLQQFAAYQQTNGTRLLDYVDIHTYFAANGAAFNTAGDTTLQQARLNSTRVFWDPTYTDSRFTDPNNRTSSAPAYPPQLIPMMRNWVATDYPGTKIAIDEYNWGGQEAINGALAQADILGIFGREGLDSGLLWGPPSPTTQVPGLVAFEVYRNYDGAGSKFGDTALASTSANQGQLSVYGAQRTADGVVTIVIVNKTYGDLTSTLSLPNLTATGPVKVFLYNNANIAGIVAQSSVTLTPPATGSTTSTLSQTFPAQSITILVVPTM